MGCVGCLDLIMGCIDLIASVRKPKNLEKFSRVGIPIWRRACPSAFLQKMRQTYRMIETLAAPTHVHCRRVSGGSAGGPLARGGAVQIQEVPRQVRVVFSQTCSNLGLRDPLRLLGAVHRDELGLRQRSHGSLLLLSSLTDLGNRSE